MGKINASVGGGKDAVNDPKDVRAVQKMLYDHADAVGYKAPRTSGRIDQPTIYAIGQFQHDVVKTRVTSLVEPGSKTLKMLEMPPKKVAHMMECAIAGAMVECKEVTISGRTYHLTQKDYDRAIVEVCKKLGSIIRAMRSHYETIDETAQFYTNAATGASGFLDALVMWSSSFRADLAPPYFPAQGAALVKLQRAEKAVKSKDVMKASIEMPLAQKAINAYAKEVKVYGDKFCGGAKDMQETLELVRDTSFEIAKAIGTAYGTSRGRSPAQAKAASSALFAMIKTASTEYGRTLAGYDTKIEKQAMTVLFDGAVAGAKGAIDAKYIDKAGGWAATKVVGKPPFSHIGITNLQKITKNFLHGAAKQSISELFDGSVKTAADAGKAKAITGKKYDFSGEIWKTFKGGVLNILTAGLFKNFDAANRRAAIKMKVRTREFDHFNDDWFQSLKKKEQNDLWADIIKANEKALLKEGWSKAAKELEGLTDPKKIADKVTEKALASNLLEKAIKQKIAEAKKK